MVTPQVSVVVATRGRPESLQDSIRSVLRAAEVAQAACEVIVVDDGPDAATAAASRDFGGRVRYLVARDHGARGPGAARNVGIVAAHASIIAFTDDDTRCDERWFVTALEHFERDPALVGVEGAVVATNVPGLRYDRARVVRDGGGGGYLTANLWARREAIESVGGFRSLPYPFREDTDFGLRLVAQAGPVTFAPQCVVRHPIQELGWSAHLRTARYFSQDEPFLAAHPGALPSVAAQPLARLRIRLGVFAVVAASLAVLHPKARRPALAGVVGAGLLISAQVESDLRAAGVRRPARNVVTDTVTRTPRSIAWAVLAGAARIAGIVQARVLGRRFPDPSLPPPKP